MRVAAAVRAELVAGRCTTFAVVEELVGTSTEVESAAVDIHRTDASHG